MKHKDLYEERFAGPAIATDIAAADPEHIRQRRGHVEAEYNPRGEKEKEHLAASLCQSLLSTVMTIPESSDSELSQNCHTGNNRKHHSWPRLSFSPSPGPVGTSGPDEVTSALSAGVA